MLKPSIIFRGRDVQVVADLGTSSGPVLVTFQSANIGPEAEQGFSARGFAENYTRKKEIPAVFFKSSRNHWYQTVEMDAAVLAAKAAIGSGREIVAYGSSMGAYGAIMTSRALETSRVLALSPQYSIDPAKAPFEYRYRKYADRLHFIRDDIKLLANPKSEIFLFYDPFDLDAQHAALFDRTDLNIKLVKVPFGSHPAASMMKAAGLLTAVTDAVVAGTFSPESFTRPYAQNKRGAEKFWLRSFKYLKEHNRTAYLRLFCREALARGFNVNQINVWLLSQCRTDKAFAEGRALLASQTADFFQRDPVVARTAARLLLAAGDPDGALTYAKAAVAGAPDDARNVETLDRALSVLLST